MRRPCRPDFDGFGPPGTTAVRPWSGLTLTSMLEGLLGIEGGDAVLPFVSQFYSSASTCLWENESKVSHEIIQGEGGEQGDPLMSVFFAVGQHRALVATSERLLPDEHFMAFLDDTHVMCRPEHVVPHSHLGEGTVVAPRPDSDPPRQNFMFGTGVRCQTTLMCLQWVWVDPEAIVLERQRRSPHQSTRSRDPRTPLEYADFVRGLLIPMGPCWRDLDVLTSMAWLWRLPVEGRSSVTQSSPGDRGERDWLSWRPKWEEGGHRRRRTFLLQLAKAKVCHEPKVMRVSANARG